MLESVCQPEKDGWNDARLLSAAGFACSQLNRWDSARTFYQRWVEVEPDRAQPFYCLGYVFYQKGRWEEALEWFEQALHIFPEYLVCLYRAAYAAYQWDKARQSLKYLERAETAYRSLQDETLIKRQRKTYYRCLFLLGKCHYRIRKYEQALEYFRQAWRQPKPYLQKSAIFYQAGKALARLNRFPEALQALNSALDASHPQHFVLDRIGRVHLAEGKPEAALNWFNKALKIRRFPFIYVNRADAYLRLGRTAEAVQDLHFALKRDTKGKHKIYLKLAEISMKTGRGVEARHYLQRAIQFKRKVYGVDYAEAHYRLSLYYRETGEKEKAKSELQQAMNLDPSLEWRF